MAREIQAFSAQHPDLPLRVLFLPVDFAASPLHANEVLGGGQLDAPDAPWTELATMLEGVSTTALSLGDGDFLAGDYHLSAEGQRKLGDGVVGACGP